MQLCPASQVVLEGSPEDAQVQVLVEEMLTGPKEKNVEGHLVAEALQSSLASLLIELLPVVRVGTLTEGGLFVLSPKFHQIIARLLRACGLLLLLLRTQVSCTH